MTTSGYSPAISICFIASWPMTVWWSRTWFSTLPSEYFVSSRVRRVLDRLADGDAERAGALGIALEHAAAGVRVGARAGDRPTRPRSASSSGGTASGRSRCGPCRPCASMPNMRAGEGERRAPLAGAGLGGDALHAFLLVVVGLRDGGVRLVRAGRARRLRTCSRCGRAYRAPSPGGARGSAASAARAGRSRAPRPGSSMKRSCETSCLISSIGNSGASASGPIGWCVPGCSGGGGGDFRSAAMLYHCVRDCGLRRGGTSSQSSHDSFAPTQRNKKPLAIKGRGVLAVPPLLPRPAKGGSHSATTVRQEEGRSPGPW